MSTARQVEPQRLRPLHDSKRALYRYAVLDAAEHEFAHKGYEQTKVQDIVSRARVSLTTLYSVFENKWNIYRAVHERRLQELMQRVADVMAKTHDPLALMARGIEAYLAFHLEHPDYLKMHLKEGHAWATENVLRSPEQTHAWQTGLRLWTDVLRTGIEQGDVIEDDPELLARTTVATHQVRMALWISRGMKQAPETVIDEAITQFFRLVCRPERLEASLRKYRART